MTLFSTTSAYHLAQHIPMQKGDCVIKRFSDGELYVQIKQNVAGKQVWVIAATNPPADNLLELFFLLDALRRGGASISLLITYLSYARQVVAAPGEAHSAQLICSVLNSFKLSQVLIMHPHSELLHKYLTFKAVYDLEFFCDQAKEYDAIAAPDAGAFAFAKEIANICNKDLIALTKTRPEHEQVTIQFVDGLVASKKILLVDDIIATGRTLATAAQELKKEELLK